MIYFQDVPTGFENVNQDKGEIREDEGVAILRQVAEEEEQDSFVMSTLREEVTFQKDFNLGSILSVTYQILDRYSYQYFQDVPTDY